jgi:hypothetical protein
VSILLTVKIYFYMLCICKNVYCFMNLNRPYDEIYVLDNLNSLIIFNYINDV